MGNTYRSMGKSLNRANGNRPGAQHDYLIKVKT